MQKAGKMMKDWKMVLRYLISSEESRIGRQDYWRSVFLASRTPVSRVCLELSKVLFILTLCTSIMMVLNRL
jgi:hypothetical protein